MRKIFIFIVLIALTTGFAIAQNKNVAVVTFFINKEIDVTEFGAPAYLAVKKLGDDPAFNLAPMLSSFHKQFMDEYSKSFPFNLLPEDQVIKNEAYKAYTPVGIANSGILNATNFLIPVNGYKIFLNMAGHENEKNMLKIFNQADGVMDVTINFKLVKIGLGGMGVVKVNANANMTLFNKNGDKVFSVDQDAKSKSVSPLVGGVPVMTPEKIIPMCESAMAELMAALQKDLPKMIKKADAKL